VGIFYGRESSRHARPTHLRAATPRRCDGFSFRIDGSRSLLSRADQWPGERVVAKHRRRKSRNFHFHFHFFHRPLYVQVPPTTSLPRRRDLEKFFNFSDLENFSTFFFSTTSSLYRKVVDVPGSNCTKKSISEFLPDFHLSSGRAARSTAARSPPKTGLGNFRT